MSDVPALERDRNEARSKLYHFHFDRLLLGLIAAGLIITLLYGGSAGTCPPDPQRAASVSSIAQQAAALGVIAPGAAKQGDAPAAPVAALNKAATATSTATTAARPAECSQGSSLVGILLALIIALAALAVGAFIGFLFGLPRTLTSPEIRNAVQAAAGQKAQDAPADDSPGDRAINQATGVNTNLEKISDWLTTIIVGVGLTKLQDIPAGIDEFGDRIAPYFGFGGKVFGIAAGLFFLTGGFFLAYVGTRVKLSLIFLWSQLTHRGAELTFSPHSIIQTAISADPVRTDAKGPVSEEVRKADAILLSKSLSDLKTSDEVLAWANAKARAGDFASALAAYRDVRTRVPQTEKLQTDYAQVLAGAGERAAANTVVADLATAGISAEAEQELRQKVAAAVQAGQAAAMRTRLQQGLYKPPSERGFEDSIVAGEELLARTEHAQDAWAHVWLAAAYGQKHAAEKAAAGANPNQDQKAALAALRARAVTLVRKALEIDSKVKPTLRSLYDPSQGIADDDDLVSLNPDPELDPLLLDKPSDEAAPDPAINTET